jgi:hypothetical protein
VRLMNRFRKTGTYIKQDLTGGDGLNDPLARAGAGGAGGLFSPDPYVDDGAGARGDNYYDEEYEGGEKVEDFPDIDNDLAR